MVRPIDLGQSDPGGTGVGSSHGRAAPRFAGHPHGKALEDAVALIAATEAGQRAVAQGRQLLAADALLAAGDLDGAEKGYASLAKTDDATVKEAADRGQRRVAARRAPK